MPEWRPGVLAGLLAETTAAGKAGQRRGLLLIAAAIEAKAKAELAKTSHRYGTPSPAPRGGPPSLISGTGRRSITHQEISTAIETILKVGTAAGVFPPKRGNAKTTTPSSKYLYYQEKGHPPHTSVPFNHPFLMPSYKAVVGEIGVSTWWAGAFGRWPRLI